MSTKHTRGLRLRATPDMDTRDCAVVNAGIVALEAQRDYLLAALQTIVSDKGNAQFNDDLEAYDAALAVARAAIAKATA